MDNNEYEPTERMINKGLMALLQCTYSELEDYSWQLMHGYTDDVIRVYKAMVKEVGK